ncbi:leucine carboxyl methyltransferase [Nitzschia inconspicua]|uniref:Leucine carboxyl methyltransferase n=1 Tax=Nitzschia inconspicua TaxID=303405 RepID=A0A9K3LHB1_9STRA|nr:leucine carboxyl methyltransferase [Nitzschia inconspicua]
MTTTTSSSSIRWSVVLLVSTAATLLLLVTPTIATNPSDSTSPTVSNNKSNNTTHHDGNNNDIYRQLQVPSPTPWRFGGLNRWSWKIHGKLLPWLHFADPIAVPDVYVNLRVLWCKALSSFHNRSPAFDADHLAYRMLPRSTRWPLRYFGWAFPRWMHANIELRTAYLNQIIEQECKRIQQNHNNNNKTKPYKICMIILGAGYDPRAAKLILESKVDRVYELDLPAVAQSKRALLERAFGGTTTTTATKDELTIKTTLQDQLYWKAVDLNDERAVDQTIDDIATDLYSDGETTPTNPWYTILVSEALLLYLNPGVAGRILQRISARFGNNKNKKMIDRSAGASFVFVDRLELQIDRTDDPIVKDPPGQESIQSQARKWLLDCGWILQDFKQKPGATRHLGLAFAV